MFYVTLMFRVKRMGQVNPHQNPGAGHDYVLQKWIQAVSYINK